MDLIQIIITADSFYRGHCTDFELVSSLARVRNSRSLFQSNISNYIFGGDLAAVHYSGVSTRRELTVSG